MTADPDDLTPAGVEDPLAPLTPPPDVAAVMSAGRSVNDPRLLRSLARYVAYITGGLLVVVAVLGAVLVVRGSENTAAWAFVASLSTLIATCIGVLGSQLSTRTTQGALKDSP